MKLLLKAPAKINLTLDVLHKRPDGYHELEMVMTTIDLADRLELQSLEEDQILVRSFNRYVPDDERNLAWQAAHLLKGRYGIKKGVAITIEKKIPVAAGLAGGSSDAAAVLKGLNRMWDLRLSITELADLGAMIGSDVSFCVYGGTALAKGRGELITPLPPPPNCWVVLAKPPIGVSTKEIYDHLQLDRIVHPDTQGMLEAIHTGDYDRLCKSAGNALEAVTFARYPQTKQLRDQMLRFGADCALMSGSGPTIYSLTRHESRMHRIYNGLRGFCRQVYAVRMIGKRDPNSLD